jgi:hypothetical protein
MDDFVENLCECVLEHASKPKYQEKLKCQIINPCIQHLSEKLYPFVMAMSGVVTVMLLLLVVILMKKTHVN